MIQHSMLPIFNNVRLGVLDARMRGHDDGGYPLATARIAE
jgi:hypothetical protein